MNLKSQQDQYYVNGKFRHLDETHPKLTKQWRIKANGTLRPSDVTALSSLKVHWRCYLHTEYEAINIRVKRGGCKTCLQKADRKRYEKSPTFDKVRWLKGERAQKSTTCIITAGGKQCKGKKRSRLLCSRHYTLYRAWGKIHFFERARRKP